MSQEPNLTEKKIAFWATNPNALLDPSHILELFPSGEMTYEQKLNSVSRMVVVLCIVFYFVLRTWRVVVIGMLTLVAIWALYFSQKKNKKVRFEEGFQNVAEDYIKNHILPTNIFGEATETNPMQNVMLTDYDSAPDKRPAPASYTEESHRNILQQTKNMIDEVNPEQPKISEKLFKGLEDSLAFEQSMRPFYSTANTTIPNDQGAFAEFCYGGMVSCKEGNPFACARNLARHTN